MKIKTSELTDAALDWAVANCWYSDRRVELTEGKTGVRVLRDPTYDGSEYSHWFVFFGSTDWSQAGPIIEREDISFRKYHRPDSEAHGTYYARICRESGTMVGWYKTTGHQQTGPTPLIAAMRCYVASKLGNTIDIPQELCK